MRAEFARIFAAEGERVGGINAARDHPHERFIFFRLGPRYFFKFQHFRCAVLVGDDRLHHRRLVGAYDVTEESCENRETYERKFAEKHLHYAQLAPRLSEA